MGAIEAPTAPTRSTMYSVQVRFSGQVAADLRKSVIDHGVEIDRSAEYGVYGILKPTDLKEATLVGVTLADLGLGNRACNQEVMKAADLAGLAIPPQETALVLSCMSGMNFSGAGAIVMSRPIQSLAKAADSILLGVVDGGNHRTIVGTVGAPRWRVAGSTLLVFMQKPKGK